ncbi:hypothetical protein SAMN06265337_2310 [Hymenobacter gelipurpurascens]|uniref:Adhesin domain-containing protein n=1 Tax=Hymenobacter gelipurpurascens TaxID=89968 RepID=A0A212TR04_9BACT|nr:hypothetical protein [Hymenobacter gelipurpurascens]SNC68429.1 hypothetical protein SAMN06265337_2310 [Hymenobacter gelipurpurascens]
MPQRQRRRCWLVVLLLLSSATLGQAQTKVQVVTRTIEKTLPLTPTTRIYVQGEKATVHVQGWDKPTARLVLRLVAKHPDRAVAERELQVMQYRIEQTGNDVNLRNFFTLAAGTTLQSNLRAEYTLWVPAKISLQITNAYGETMLTSLSGLQEILQEFGQIKLQDLQGQLTITSKYADITARNLDLTFTCHADKAAIRLTDAAGRYTIYNTYGSIRVEPTAGLTGLQITAARTEVTIVSPQMDLYSYEFTTLHGNIKLPANTTFSPGVVNTRTFFQVQYRKTDPLIRVNTSYAPVTLQINPLLLRR